MDIENPGNLNSLFIAESLSKESEGISTQPSGNVQKESDVATRTFFELEKTNTPIPSPVSNRIVTFISGIESSFAELRNKMSECAGKIGNIVMQIFFPKTVDVAFIKDSISDFKGITKEGDYILPRPIGSGELGYEYDNGKMMTIKAGASFSVGELLGSKNPEYIGSKLTNTRMPKQFFADIKRAPMEICGISNDVVKRAVEDENKSTDEKNNSVSNFYNQIKDKFTLEGVGEPGLLAACEIMQQGVVGDISHYITSYLAGEEGYKIKSTDDLVLFSASFKNINGNRVFQITTTLNNHYGVEDADSFIEKGCLTVTRTINISVDSLKKITKIDGADGKYSFENLPADVKGSDKWDAYKPINKPNIEEQIAKGMNGAIEMSDLG